MTGRAMTEPQRAMPAAEVEVAARPVGSPRVAPASRAGRFMLTPAHRVVAPLVLRGPVSDEARREAGATLRAAVAEALRAEIGRGLDGPLGREIAEALRPLVREEVRQALASDDL